MLHILRSVRNTRDTQNTISKMLDEIHDNKKLIEDYINVEKRLL